MLEPALGEGPRPIAPPGEEARDNLAVVRMWWTVLESEWLAALGNGGGAIVEPCVRNALEPFDEFDASLEELLACGPVVVAAVRLRGRIGEQSIDATEAWLCRLEEGTITEVRDYPTVQRALLAAAAPTPPAAVPG